MRMMFHGSSVHGNVDAPPSKSGTHRAIFMSALADGVSHIRSPLLSDDTLRSIDVVKALGADVHIEDDLTITGGDLHVPSDVLFAGNSGTTARFSMSVASLLDGDVTINGDGSFRARPMDDLATALSDLGVECDPPNRLPIRIRGPNRGGSVNVSGRKSSQPISAMLLAAPMMRDGLNISVDGMMSAPYIDMTIGMMHDFGADVRTTDNGFIVEPSGYRGCDITIPGDPSSAAYTLAAGALAGNVRVNGLQHDSGGDMRILNILKDMGADIDIENKYITSGSSRLLPVELDMGNTPDLVPIVAVMMSVCEGKSIIRNIAHLRFKESDRIATTVDMINDLGGNAIAHDDDIIIRGVQRLKGGEVRNHNDHRIMMSAAIASLVCEAPVVMNNSECHSVSYPKFIQDINAIGITTEVLGV